MTQNKVHVRRTIVVEYDNDREDYARPTRVFGDYRDATDAEIRDDETSTMPWDIWEDLSDDIVTSHTTEVTFR